MLIILINFVNNSNLYYYIYMIYTEIIQNSGGRTGHKLIDLLTAFGFYFICGYKTIRNNHWKSTKNNCNNHIDMFNLDSSDIFVDKPNDYIKIEYKLRNWKGMKYTQFVDIITEINKLQKENANKSIIVKLSKSTRIQLCDIYNWEKANLIKKDTYNKLTSHLRELLLSYPQNNQLKVISNREDCINICIHIRKGDVFTRPLHKCLKYFKNVINCLKKIKQKKYLYIFTEKWEGYDGKDVLDLINLNDENTHIEVIFEICLYEYFIDIINSDVFVAAIGQGGFSDIVSHYKSKNTTLIYNNERRGNYFEDSKDNMIIQTIWEDKDNKRRDDTPGFFNIELLKNNLIKNNVIKNTNQQF